MRTASLILAFTAAAVIALPPQWCQVIAGEPVACCPGCTDDCGEHDAPAEHHCQCGNTPFKQPETVATTVPSACELLPPPIFTQSAGATLVATIPERDFQQLLCCWRN